MIAKIATSIASIIVLCAFLKTGMGVRIDISPTEYTELSKGGVNISCLASKAEQKKGIAALAISRKGESHLAYVRPEQPVTRGTDVPDEYKIQGHIAANVGEASFLIMTIAKPKNEDAGTYVCKSYYFDPSGGTFRDSATGHLTIDVLNINTLIRTLVTRVNELEGEAQSSNTRVATLEKDALSSNTRVVTLEKDALSSNTRVVNLEKDAESSNRRVMKLEKDVQSSNIINEELNNRLLNLTNKVSLTSAFSARLFSYYIVYRNMRLMFTRVIFLQGEGYDSSLRSTFTAPVDGIYYFQLTTVSKSYGGGRRGDVSIRIDNKNVVDVYILVPKGVFSHQVSTSIVFKLTVGQEVTVHNKYQIMYVNWDTIFSGFLVKPL